MSWSFDIGMVVRIHLLQPPKPPKTLLLPPKPLRI
jgi:hypothetical protein